MRLGGRRTSSNIEDRRGTRYGKAGGIGLGTVVLALLAAYFGVDPGVVLQNAQQGAPTEQEQVPYQESASEGQARELVSVVLADTEDTWSKIFSAAGGTYQQPSLVLFSQAVQTGCGFAQSNSGPFYCPADRKVYIDLSFYQELQQRFGAPGDFAQAYVIAHEVGHHVQNLLGTMAQFDRDAQRADERRRNQLQIRLELQADCYAGVWGYFANKRNLLEAGDLEEGLRAAGAVGDDQIMKRTQGYVVPEAFTHGAAEQRVRWFRKGLASGDPRQCDTFSTSQL